MEAWKRSFFFFFFRKGFFSSRESGSYLRSPPSPVHTTIVQSCALHNMSSLTHTRERERPQKKEGLLLLPLFLRRQRGKGGLGRRNKSLSGGGRKRRGERVGNHISSLGREGEEGMGEEQGPPRPKKKMGTGKERLLGAAFSF